MAVRYTKDNTEVNTSKDNKITYGIIAFDKNDIKFVNAEEVLADIMLRKVRDNYTIVDSDILTVNELYDTCVENHSAMPITLESMNSIIEYRNVIIKKYGTETATVSSMYEIHLAVNGFIDLGVDPEDLETAKDAPVTGDETVDALITTVREEIEGTSEQEEVDEAQAIVDTLTEGMSDAMKDDLDDLLMPEIKTVNSGGGSSLPSETSYTTIALTTVGVIAVGALVYWGYNTFFNDGNQDIVLVDE